MKFIPTRLLVAGVSAFALSAGAAKADQQILDDLIVDGSACIGLDCVNGESFGFDTIRIKENNLRIKAQDTSSSASFPTNDWQLTFNDSSNGGANKFSIDDIDGGRTPFTIEASAPSHSLYVDDGGRIGLGSNAPVVELHVKDGDTPTLRLEQDGSSGFTPQIFDVAANETNFFVRDVTNGSQLPFRITPGADSNSLFIAADNSIGMGTASPRAHLHVVKGGAVFTPNAAVDIMIQDNASTTDAAIMTIVGGATGTAQVGFGDAAAADNEIKGRIRYVNADNQMEFYTGFGTNPVITLDVAGTDVITTSTSSAVLTSAGVWQDASSRALKQNIRAMDLAAARTALSDLEPVTYQYIKEPDEMVAGFVAEDVPEMVATSSRKTLSALDITAVLTRVVQDQQETIARLEARIDALEQ